MMLTDEDARLEALAQEGEARALAALERDNYEPDVLTDSITATPYVWRDPATIPLRP